VFGTDMTDTQPTYEACGAAGTVAETAVCLRGPGMVARCQNCPVMLMVISRIRGFNCVDLGGPIALDARRAG
jgi:Family of unknown function (DUF6510)